MPSAGSPRSVLQRPSSEVERGLRVVVLGAGVAGVLSAHVACQHAHSVWLVEGDSLAAGGGEASAAEEIMKVARQRRGIPQLAHPHTLAMGGLEAMEALLPGFKEEILRRGGVELDLARDLRFFDFGDVYKRADDSCLKSVGASRALIQATLQDEVLARNAGKLRVMDGCRASGLLWSEDKSRVLGVELSTGERLEADLVIVACGRSCLLPQWLKAAGHPVPAVLKVNAGLTYVGRLYRMPEDWDKKRWLGCITLGRPNGIWGAGMVPVEGGVWQMVEWGYEGNVPPMEDAAFLEAAGRLPDTEIYEAIRRAEPLTPLEKYGGAYNICHSWEKVPPPPGVLAIGDAVQTLNPVYAQGMSVAAKSAEALDAAMAAALPAGGSLEARRAAAAGMGRAFHQRLAAVIAPAWMMATSEDLRYPGTKAQGVVPPPRLLSLYIDSLCKASHRSSKVMELFFCIAHLVKPPHYLFHPRLLAAGIQQMLRDALQALWPASQPTKGALKAE